MTAYMYLFLGCLFCYIEKKTVTSPATNLTFHNTLIIQYGIKKKIDLSYVGARANTS